MKLIRPIVFFIVLVMMLANDGRPHRAAATGASRSIGNRIRFQIVAVEENGASRFVISETIVEGPLGTDFNINLQASRFKMEARFLTDLVAAGALRIRAKIETRRFYGYSENQLPLYEEDRQNHALDLGFDEEIVLLPFGQVGGNRLKIEITPSMTNNPARTPSGELRPLEINILKQSPGGSINVEAFKRPHNFEVEATLFEDGRAVASAVANCLLEQPQELLLLPNEQASPEVINNPLAVRFTVSEFIRSRPVDEVIINFDAYSLARNREAVATNWAGAGPLGHSFKYGLGNHYLSSSGKSYELRFAVKLVEGEEAN